MGKKKEGLNPELEKDFRRLVSTIKNSGRTTPRSTQEEINRIIYLLSLEKLYLEPNDGLVC